MIRFPRELDGFRLTFLAVKFSLFSLRWAALSADDGEFAWRSVLIPDPGDATTHSRHIPRLIERHLGQQ